MWMSRGKLIGAGGGFSLNGCQKQEKNFKTSQKKGYLCLEFVIDKDGSKII